MRFINDKKGKKGGYTLLFAVIVSTLVLSVAAFILSVSRKQLILSSAVRDSMYAFYAADTGIECAAENLNNLATTSDGTVSTISCGKAGDSWTLVRSWLGGNPSSGIGTSTFSMRVSSIDAKGVSCVTVETGQWYDASGNQYTDVISRGYNLGWQPPSGVPGSSGDCSVTGPRKVERALRLRYR